MNYEVTWGEETQFVEAGNPYQACILAMAEHVPDCISSVFVVKRYPDMFCEKIPFESILNICLLNGDYVSQEVVGLFDGDGSLSGASTERVAL